MYLPENQYRIKHTPGNEFLDDNGNSYVGFYIETEGDKYFKGSNILEASEEITPVSQTNSTNQLDFPFNEYVGPTDQDYINESFIRYIIYDRTKKWFKEVSKSNFEKLLSRNNLLQGIKIIWNLNRIVEDNEKTSYLKELAKQRNEKILSDLEIKYKGISSFLSSDEFLI